MTDQSPSPVCAPADGQTGGGGHPVSPVLSLHLSDTHPGADAMAAETNSGYREHEA